MYERCALQLLHRISHIGTLEEWLNGNSDDVQIYLLPGFYIGPPVLRQPRLNRILVSFGHRLDSATPVDRKNIVEIDTGSRNRDERREFGPTFCTSQLQLCSRHHYHLHLSIGT
jgi:hypothetical protein